MRQRPTSDAARAAAIRRRAQVATVVGLVSAMVIAVLSNMLAARHFRRWDWTDAGLFTLSPVTKQILGRIDEPVEVIVLLGDADPATLTVRHLLDAYRAQAPQLVPRFVDPDRSPAEFLSIQQKYDISAAKTEGGQVVTDAAVIVVRGDRRHFITADEMFDLDAESGAKARPRVEKALTTALRQVYASEPARVCFSRGYGELDTVASAGQGTFALRGVLEKANFEITELPPVREVAGADPIERCELVVLAGPSVPVEAAEARRLVRYFDQGGNLLVAVGPETDDDQGFADLGLGPVLASGGIAVESNIVFELDPARRLAGGVGDAFIAEPAKHPVTTGFVDLQGAIAVPLQKVSSLSAVESSPVVPSPLLTTSPQSFGMRDLRRYDPSLGTPEPAPGDPRGPLVVAYAVELPKRKAAASHGPRMVVFGTKDALIGLHWTADPLRGTGLLVESAISWLADDSLVLEIPDKPARELGLELTAQSLQDAFWRVVVFIPLSTLILGLAIGARRRFTEGRDEDRDRAEDESPKVESNDAEEES